MDFHNEMCKLGVELADSSGFFSRRSPYEIVLDMTELLKHAPEMPDEYLNVYMNMIARNLPHYTDRVH
jgi:hypothetical protein